MKDELVSKQVTIKLFYNRGNKSFYIQIGDSLIQIRATLITAIQERENMTIRHVDSIREMQTIDNEHNG